MGFWIYMFVIDISFPLLLIILGKYFSKNAPKKINMLLGYRTSRSMKSTETWVFAHEYFGRIWFIGGFIVLFIVAPIMLSVIGRDVDTVGFVGAGVTVFPLILIIISIILTEKALKKNFNQFGRKIK